jgi:HD-like signal output (HDOD) protein
MLVHENTNPAELVVHELHADVRSEPLSDQQLWDALIATFQGPRYQPPVLPRAAAEVMEGDADAASIARLLEEDERLAHRVLKLCNSPLYSAETGVTSLTRALSGLSPAELRDVVMEAAIGGRVFKSTGYSEAVDRVRLHSVAVAHLSRELARLAGIEAEHAFLCGLLHDVGFSAALVALGSITRGRLRSVADLWPALAALHETIGGSVATLWRLPSEVTAVMRLHHSLRVGELVHPVAAVVTLAESLAVENGFGLVPSARRLGGAAVPSLLFGAHRVDAPSWAQVEVSKIALGLDEAQLAQARLEAVRVLERVRAVRES